jgi:hypothetical protein
MVGAAIGTAAQVGASIYGAIKSSQANKKAMDILKAQKDENKKWYEERMGEDYLQRADVQNVLRKQRELLGEQYKRARATNVVAGGTDESLAMQQQAANEIMGDTMGNIAAQAESYKEGVENQYRSTDAALAQQEMGIHQAQAQTIANAAGQVGKAVSGLVSGVGMDAANATDGAEASADFISKQKEWSSGFEPTTKTDVTKYNVG